MTLTKQFNRTLITKKPLQKRFWSISIAGTLSAIAVTVGGCAWQSETIDLASGSEGSGYQRIARQIAASSSTVGNLEVRDSYDSQGSLENLQRLLDKEVDFAIVQLDVASEAMKKGQVQTLAVLTQEYLHLVTRSDSGIETFADLAGKRVAVGTPGSGVYFTARRIFQGTNIKIREVRSSRDRVKKLLAGEIDAFVYVGPLGSSQTVRNELSQSARLRFIPVAPSLINYLTIQFPESYRQATIPQGIYKPLPELPDRDLPTISTPGALVTRPDTDKKTVALLTWSIISTVRQYSPFYPELSTEDGESLLDEGLIYLHPGAQQAFTQGDPRGTWLRYLRDNKPLQAASIMLISTSTIGFLLRWWRKQRSANLIKTNRQAIAELRSLLEQNPEQAIEDIDALRQQYRLMLIDGAISPDIYEQIERMTQVFADQCRTWQQHEHQKSVRNTLSLLDRWQELLEMNPEKALPQLKEFEQTYRTMLMAGQLDIPTYLQLKQIRLLAEGRVKEEIAIAKQGNGR